MVYQIFCVCGQWRIYPKILILSSDLCSQQLLTAKPFPACIVSLGSRSSSGGASHSCPTLTDTTGWGYLFLGEWTKFITITVLCALCDPSDLRMNSEFRWTHLFALACRLVKILLNTPFYMLNTCLDHLEQWHFWCVSHSTCLCLTLGIIVGLLKLESHINIWRGREC